MPPHWSIAIIHYNASCMGNFYFVRAIFIVLFLMLLSQYAVAQSTCSDPQRVCETINFPAKTNTASLGTIRCLVTTPNPTYLFFEVATGGNATISETNSANIDVDFALLGPYTSISNMLAACGNLLGNAQPVESCSYSTSANESITFTGAAAGEFYLLIITNFRNLPTNINLAKVAGSGNATFKCCTLNATAVATPDCTGSSGSVTVTATNTSTNVQYSKDNGATFQTSNVFNNLTPGTYSLVVKDDSRCVKYLTATVAQPVQNNFVTPPSQALCTNTQPATLQGTTPTGATGSYTYLWEQSTTSATAGFSAAAGVNNQQNYTPGLITQTTWYRRVVTSGPCSSTTTGVPVNITQTTATAAAGNDQNLCNVTTTTLAGNTPAAGTGTGTWTKESGPAAVITTPSSANTTVTGLTPGTYIFRWTITNSPCGSNFDEVQVVISALPTTAAAGPDQNLCNVTSATLAGNTAVSGTGAWTKVSGPSATITNTASATSTVTGLTPGTYTFRWTISNGGCTPSTDDVTIVVNALPTTANAGTDQNLCNITNATLGGNTPVTGTGTWTKVSGPAANITSPANATTGITGLTPGTYVFRWTITNGNCTASSDDVQLTVAANPTTANAGPDQALCNVTSTTMAAGAVTAGAGAWSSLSGPTTPVFTNPASPTTTVTGLAPGTYEFVWSVTNSPCAASTDNVKVLINALPSVANAGADKTQFNSGAFVMTGNTPAVGTGTWTVVTGNANIANPNAPNSNVTLNPNTTATLRWTISNGNCASSADDVTLTYTQSTDLKITKSDAGSVYQTGKKVVYTITVENLGPSDAQGFIIADNQPGQLENYTWNAATTGNGVTISPSSGTGNTINCLGTIPFAPGNKIVITLEGFVRAGVTGGATITNSASVTASAGVTDPVPGNNNASVTGIVQNNPPVANNDQYTTVRDVAVSGNVLTNDTDPENDPLTVTTTPFTPPAHGVLVLNANGTFTYTPSPGYTGTDVFVYTVCDNKGGCSQGTVTISVTAPVTDLSVTKTSNPTQVVAGADLTYTITITNAGPSTILPSERFVVEDNFPAEFTANTYTASEGTFDAVSGGWTGVQFTPGKSITLTIAGHISASFTGNSIVNTANVTPPPNFTDPTPATGSVTTPASRSIDLQITKTDGKTSYVPGTNTIYTINVTNTGPSDVAGAQVSDLLPAGITNASWSANVSGGATVPANSGTGAISQLVNIPVNGTIVYTFTMAVPPAFTGNLVNTATVTAPSGYTENNTANNTATDTDTPDLQYDISISKTAPSSAVAGGAIHYEIVIQNAGPSNVVNAVIADAVPASIQNTTWTVSTQGAATASVASGTGNNISFTGSLPVGNANIIVVAVNGTISASAAGVIQNTASITPPGKPVSNSNSTFTTLLKQTGLTVVKSGPVSGSIAAGTPIEYIIQVTNAGPSDATGVVITDVVPAAVTNVTWYVSPRGSARALPDGGSGNNISTTGDIAAGTGNIIEIHVNGIVQPSFTGVLTNVATVTPPGGTAITDSDVTTVENTPGLVITKAGPAQADAGGAIAYTLSVSNTGPSNAVNASITDLIHADIENVQWTAAAGGAATIVSGATGTGNNVGLTVNIPAGSGNTVTVQITGKVKPGASGTAKNTASVQVTGQPAVTSNEVSTAIQNRPGITIIKTAADTVIAGEMITYFITVHNTGPSDAFNVVIRDTLAPQLQHIVLNTQHNGTADVSSDAVNGQIVDVRANIPAGSGNSVLIVITATVDPSYSGDIFNRATARLANGTDLPGAQVKTVVKSEPLIKITKSAPAEAIAGDNIVYVLTVTNEGHSDAPEVNIEDLIPADLTNVTWVATTAGRASVLSGATGTGNILRVRGVLPADPQGKIVVTITGKVNPAATADLANFATAMQPGQPAIHSDTTDTKLIFEPALQITKSAPASVSAGNAIAYTVIVSNHGLSDAQNITITDVLEAEIKNARWTATAANGATVLSGSAGSGSNVNVTGNIPAGTGTITININGTIDPAFKGVVTNTATATVSGQPPVSSNANTNATNTASVRVKKTGPVSIIAGNRLTYDFVITNDGPSDAKNILISDIIPAAILNPSWIATGFGSATVTSGGTGSGANMEVTGNIPFGSGNRILITVGGTADPAFEGSITNSATAKAEDQPLVHSDTVTTSIINKPNLSVFKLGSSSLAAGSKISYIVSVANSSPASNAKNVTITDVIPAQVKNATWSVVTSGNAQVLTGNSGSGNNVAITANIPSQPASDLTIYIDGVVDADFTGTLENYASVQVPGQPLLTSDTVKTLVTNEVAVQIVKSAPPKLAAGEQITYTLNITNDGPSNASNLQIRDTVPASITNVTWVATASGNAQITGTANGTGNIIGLTGSFPPGVANAVIVTITGVIQPGYTGAPIENRGYALPVGKAVVSDTAATIVETRPGINITKSGPASLKAGQPVTYNIRVTNAGPSDAIGLVIKDTIHAAIQNPAWTIVTSGAGTTVSSSSGTGNINVTGNLPAGNGNVMDITVTGKVDPSFSGTSIRNTAYAVPAGLPGVSSTVITNTTRSADLRISKSGPANATAGENITYTLEVTNGGPSNATNISIKDTVSTLLTNITWTAVANGNATVSAASGVGSVINLTGNLAADGSTIVVTINGTINPAAPNGVITNTARAIPPAGTTDFAEAISTVTTSVLRQADLVIVKSGPANRTAGESIAYKLVVTNKGLSDVTAAAIIDSLPADILNPVVTASQTGSASFVILPVVNNVVRVTGNIPAGTGNAITVNITGQVNPGSQPVAIRNTAKVLPPSDVTETVPETNSSTITTNITTDVGVLISKSGPASVNVKDPISYTIEVNNTGISNASPVKIADTIPAEITNVTWTVAVEGASTSATPLSGSGNIVGVIGTIQGMSTESSGRIIITVNGTVSTSAGLTITNTASAEFDGKKESTVVTSVNKSVDLQLNKTAPANIAAGQKIVYVLKLTNNGPADAIGAAVTDNVPVEIQNVTWKAAVTGGATVSASSGTGNNIAVTADVPANTGMVTFTIEGTIDPAYVGTLINTAEAQPAAGVTDPRPAKVSVATIVNKQTGFSVSKSGPSVVSAGLPVTYTLNVTNAGPSSATAVNITDLVPAQISNVTWSSAVSNGVVVTAHATGTGNQVALTANIPASGIVIVTIEGTADPLFNGTVSNVATAGNNDQTVTSDSLKTQISYSPTLEISKSGPGRINAGERINYVITLSNNGPSVAQNINVVDVIPTALLDVKWSAIASGNAAISGGNLTDQTGNVGFTATLPPGTANNIIITVNAQANPDLVGDIMNIARAIPGAGLPEIADTVVTNIRNVPTLRIEKAAPADVTSGSNLNYSFNVFNDGPSNAKNVTITDTLPARMQNVTWSAKGVGTATIVGGDLVNQTGHVNFVANLPAGTTNIISVTINGKTDPAFAGLLQNTAYAKPLGEALVTSNTTSTTLRSQPGLQIVKNGPQTASAGTGVSYMIELSNSGPSDAANIAVTDVIPAQLKNALWSATASGSATIAGGNIADRAGDVSFTASIPAGDGNRVKVAISGTLDAGDTSTVTNIATYTIPGEPPVSSTPVVTKITSDPGIELSKSAPDSIAAGNRIRYVIMVENAGPSNSGTINITDTVPGPIRGITWTATAAGAATIQGSTTGAGNLISLPVNIPAGTGNYIMLAIEGTVPPTFEGPLKNIARAKAGEVVLSQDSVNTLAYVSTNLNVVKTGPQVIAAGLPVHYIVNINNSGVSNATDVRIRDLVPPEIMNVQWTVTLLGNAQLINNSPASGTGNDIQLQAYIPAGTGNVVQLLVNGIADPGFTGTISNTAIAGNVNGDADTAVVSTSIIEDGRIVINKTGPLKISAGNTVSYNLSITNAGPSDLEDIDITDVVAAAITDVSWTTSTTGNALVTVGKTGAGNNVVIRGDIAGSAGNTIQVQITGKLNADATGTITNMAFVKKPDGSTVSSDTVTTQIEQEADLRIHKVAPDKEEAGTVMEYTVSLQNNGPANLKNMTVRDTVAPQLTNVTWTATATGNAQVGGTTTLSGTGNLVVFNADLAAGAANLIRLQITGTIDPSFIGNISNRAVAETVTGKRITSNIAETAIGRNANISITKTGKDNVINTDSMSYIITASNAGPSVADGAVITDRLPAAMSHINARVIGTTGNAGNVTLSVVNNLLSGTVETFPAGSSVRILVTGIVSGTGQMSNTASIAPPSRVQDTDTTDNKTPGVNTNITPQTKLKAAKEILTPAPYPVGSTIRYRLTVNNPGLLALNPVVFTDQLPARSKVSAPVITAPAKGTAVYDANTNQIRWTIGLMDGNTSAQMEYAMTIIDTGAISNKAVVAVPGTNGFTPAIPDSGLINVTSEYLANLKVVKELNTAAPYRIRDVVTFTITLTNAGPNKATRVVVEDVIAANLDVPRDIIVSAGATNYNPGTRRFVWTLDSLAANGTATLRFGIRINSGGSVTNTASGTSAEKDLVPGDNISVIPEQPITGEVVFIPNTFTPNGDGRNDKLVILDITKFPGSALVVYNRWGNIVYQSKDYQNQWDGSGLNEGTYYYTLELRTPTGIRVFKGWIELLR
ncbi:PKD domain-containing protein [Chitinophaga niabensis]|uniref:Conserved repeat domain-containing protein/gliding motility-associated C-terminal domain-containing protein n=1 Tax=Chitinophaga niabensis TaxID=536979 RepID=A0A1N6J8E3_9BACT|nr:gliding motility-associated C-terminal domain-containing protein [Chitinophaga niabensis]SIO40542.1 conserved repeat domain-containing protein/gliding motility-associated C-terminal domain-containing protein [Chitinophaga niabensis]